MTKKFLKEWLNNKDNWTLFEELVNEKELIHMPNANFERADLKHANLKHSNLFYADLSYATLHEANLKKADLYGANLEYAYLARTNFRMAYITKNTEFGDYEYKLKGDK